MAPYLSRPRPLLTPPPLDAEILPFAASSSSASAPSALHQQTSSTSDSAPSTASKSDLRYATPRTAWERQAEDRERERDQRGGEFDFRHRLQHLDAVTPGRRARASAAFGAAAAVASARRPTYRDDEGGEGRVEDGEASLRPPLAGKEENGGSAPIGTGLMGVGGGSGSGRATYELDASTSEDFAGATTSMRTPAAAPSSSSAADGPITPLRAIQGLLRSINLKPAPTNAISAAAGVGVFATVKPA